MTLCYSGTEMINKELQQLYEWEKNSFKVMLSVKELIYSFFTINLEVWHGFNIQTVNFRTSKEVQKAIDMLKQAKLMLEKEEE